MTTSVLNASASRESILTRIGAFLKNPQGWSGTDNIEITATKTRGTGSVIPVAFTLLFETSRSGKRRVRIIEMLNISKDQVRATASHNEAIKWIRTGDFKAMQAFADAWSPSKPI